MTGVTNEFSGDVMDVLSQLFESGARALDGESEAPAAPRKGSEVSETPRKESEVSETPRVDADTARQILTSAETVATNKLPEGEFRSRLRHGCDRALSTLDDPAVAAEHCRAMAREVESRR